MRKTKPRRLFYLLAIAVICILGFIYNSGRLMMLEATERADKKLLSTNLKLDTEKAQKVFYAQYRLDTDYIEKTNSVGSKEEFFNVCQASCGLFRGRDASKLCNDLQSSTKFSKYRVYFCTVRVTLENDQPLRCETINWDTFKSSCNLQVAKT